MTDGDLRFRRRNRSPRAIAILAGLYVLLAAAYFGIDAAWWIVALVLLLSLPAVWDIVADTSAGLTLDRYELAWFSGKRSGRLALAEIDRMRFDTRWDLSVRVTAILATGRKIRLPYDALPPHRDLEAAFELRGIRVERHMFTIL